MKLDVSGLRYLTREDFRVLGALEAGQRSAPLVPAEALAARAGLRGGALHGVLSELLRAKLCAHEHGAADGFRLTYPGYDFLALRALLGGGALVGVGRQIGVGKESDVFLAAGPGGAVYALKLQRLGRTSFRTVRSKRDYLAGGRRAPSWLELSRLAAAKEFAFMTALRDAGFPVPTPVAANRHALVMTLARGRTLALVRELGAHAGAVFAHLMALMLRLASCGLVHCDFNEFNIIAALPGQEAGTVAGLVEAEARARDADGAGGRGGARAAAAAAAAAGGAYTGVGVDAAAAGAGAGAGVGAGEEEDEEPYAGLPRTHPLSVVPGTGSPPILVTLIDFPQMVSLDHPNARELFEHDVAALASFFERRFGHAPSAVPAWADALAAAAAARAAGADGGGASGGGGGGGAGAAPLRLDRAVEASGFSARDAAAFDALLAAQGAPAVQRLGAVGEEEDDDDEEEEDGDEGEKRAGGDGGNNDAAGGAGSGAGGAATLAGFVTLGADVLAAGAEEVDATAGDGDGGGGAAPDTREGAAAADAGDADDVDDDDDDDDDGDDGDDDEPRRGAGVAAEDDPALLAQRPPEGARARAGGRRPRAGGEAYLRRAAAGAGVGGGGGGDAPAAAAAAGARGEVHARVKAAAERERAAAAAAAVAHRAGRASRGGGIKNSAKIRGRELTKVERAGGDGW